MRRCLTLAVALLVCAAGFAQSALKVEFPTEADRMVWIHRTSEPGALTNTLEVTGKSVELPLEGADQEKDSISVHDKATGRVATSPLKALKGTWKPAPDSYKRWFRVEVSLQHEGRAVSAGVVKLTAGKETRTEIIDPASGGIAGFTNLPPGPYRITADVKSEGRTTTTPAQTFDPQSDSGPVPKLTISVSAAVDTAPPTLIQENDSAPGTTTERPGDGQEKPRNALANIIGILIGLAILAGIGYGIYRYLQANSKETEDQLSKLGLGGSPAPASGTPVPTTPAPLQKIVLENADPTPLGAAPVAPIGAPMMANPRLVRADGSVILIPEGVQDVGREDERAIPLTGEASVSRTHAVLQRQGDAVTVSDSGSTNGTWVNGRRIDAPTPLNTGDEVIFGQVRFRYEV